MAVSEHHSVVPTVLHDRKRTQGDIRLVLVITMALDVVIMAVAAILAWNLRVAFDVWSISANGDQLIAETLPWVLVGWLVALAAQGSYSSRHFGAGPDEYRAVAIACVVTAGSVSAACYLLQMPLSRGFAVLVFALGTPLLLVERYCIRKIVHRMRIRGRLLHRVIAIGGPSGVGEVVDALRRDQYVGYQIIGVCVPLELKQESQQFSVPVLGGVSEARRLCNEMGADTVLVARGGYATSRELRRIAWALEGSSIDLVVVPSLTDVAGPRIQMRPVAGLPLLHVDQPQAGDAAGLLKRVFDIVFAGFGLLISSPLLLAVALLVKFEDRGPVFFRQPRVGREGGVFGCFKFRSMFVDADRLEESLRAADGHHGALWKSDKDPRITGVGAFIRRYSIDELPQLFNVVRGEMSLVGPRPQQPWEVETYTDWEHRRLRVRPGMTGLWQVSGRSQLSFDEAIRLDLYYVDNWSMTADLLIMARTIRAVLKQNGAY